MVKYYSDVTNKWYSTPEEATEAEAKVSDTKAKIKEIEDQRIKEIAEIDKKIEAKKAELTKLDNELAQLYNDRHSIDLEADNQIADLSVTTEKEDSKSYYSMKSMEYNPKTKKMETTFDASADSFEEFKKKIFAKESTLSGILDKFGI